MDAELPDLNLEHIERDTINEAMRLCNHNKTLAAAALGISLRCLQLKLKAYQANHAAAVDVAPRSAM